MAANLFYTLAVRYLGSHPVWYLDGKLLAFSLACDLRCQETGESPEVAAEWLYNNGGWVTRVRQYLEYTPSVSQIIVRRGVVNTKRGSVQVGGCYCVKGTAVRVDAVAFATRSGRGSTQYEVTELDTGRRLTFWSAAKLRNKAPSLA